MQYEQFNVERSVLAGCNHTELYQTCIRAGLAVRPNEARDTMILYLEGVMEPPEVDDNVFTGWRHGIIGFLTEYWESLATQVSCPAKDLKTTNPNPCFGCLDMQVVACLVQNPGNEKLIEQNRLVRRPKNS